MSEDSKILIIAPFWRRPNHLSVVRVERFIRWLDEPLKSLLQTSRLQRWREGRLERRVQRLPEFRGKVQVLTN